MRNCMVYGAAFPVRGNTDRNGAMKASSVETKNKAFNLTANILRNLAGLFQITVDNQQQLLPAPTARPAMLINLGLHYSGAITLIQILSLKP